MLKNPLWQDSDVLLQYLQEKCGPDVDNFKKIVSTIYPAMNPDFCVEFLTNDKQVVIGIETSLGQGKVIQVNEESKLIKISHASHNQKKNEHYFSLLGPHWSFFFAEVSPVVDRMAWGADKVPKTMLLLHRTIIPELWWNNNSEYLEAWVDQKYVVDMSKDVAAQIKSILLSFDSRQLDPPALQDFSNLTETQHANLRAEISLRRI